MFQDPQEYYQAIAQELAEVIDEPWTSVEVTAVRYGDSIDLEVVYFRPDGSEESRVRTKTLPDYFYHLAKAVSTEEKGYYHTCRFSLNSSGGFNVDFEYQN